MKLDAMLFYPRLQSATEVSYTFACNEDWHLKKYVYDFFGLKFCKPVCIFDVLLL